MLDDDDDGDDDKVLNVESVLQIASRLTLSSPCEHSAPSWLGLVRLEKRQSPAQQLCTA